MAFVATPRQEQAHNLVASVDELLYGGAAGGGKSEWIRWEAVSFLADTPGARAVIFRRTFPDLRRSMIPALIEQIPRAVARYNRGTHTWTFTNGSVLELAYLRSDADLANYQGAEYQMVCFDELTQFTEYQYRYLLSRLRMAGPVKQLMEARRWRPRILSTANPGGIGHAWVKARFIDPHAPNVPFRPRPGEGARVFVPAKVTDNPHIDAGYVARLEALDPDTRRALLDGDWDVYQGQRFGGWRADTHVIPAADVTAMMPSEGGGTRIVAVDYGMDAPWCALWMWMGADNTIVVYREAYEAGLTPAEQAAMIRDLEAPGERAPQRRIPVVIDPSTFTRSAHNLAKGLHGPPPGSVAAPYAATFGASQVIKADNDRLAGVALIADLLRVRDDGQPRLLVSDVCRNLIRTMPALPRDPRNPEDVDTRAEDHCLTGDTLVETSLGPRRIDSLVGDVGLVAGAKGGWVPFRSVRLTRRDAPVVRVALEDGRSVTCTDDHLLLTADGWAPAGKITPDSMVLCATIGGWIPPASAPPSRSTKDAATTSADATSSTRAVVSTDRSGQTITAPSPPAPTSITSTTILPTTGSATSPSFPPVNTSPITDGTPPTRHWRRDLETPATTPHQPTHCSPATNERKRQSEGGTENPPPHPALSAAPPSSPMSLPERSSAVAPAVPVRVAAIVPAGTSDVYDLTVDSADHAFAVNGGVIVHNCYDALRYGAMHLVGRRRTHGPDRPGTRYAITAPRAAAF